MFILFKNQNYNLALEYKFIKEIIQAKEVVEVKTKACAGFINYRDHVIPVSLLQNNKPLHKDSVFIIFENSKGVGGLWVDEVITSTNSNLKVTEVSLHQKKQKILNFKDRLYAVVDTEDYLSEGKP